jgi:hypothetical protein
MFANRASSSYNTFEQALLQYINAVAPLIRSLWSLEAAHANAADVFVFWLAVAATLKDLFAKGSDKTGIANSQVTAIFNKRYKEFFTNDIYFSAFALDPRQFYATMSAIYYTNTPVTLGYPLSDYFKKPSATVIVIPALHHRNGLNPSNKPLPYPSAHKRVKDFLKEMLRPEVERHEIRPIPALQQLTPAQIVDGLRRQLDAYWRNEWPFDQQVENHDPLAWWESLRYHSHARVLSVRVFFHFLDIFSASRV